eukprot:715873-Pyramimonas_sp.AAC.1
MRTRTRSSATTRGSWTAWRTSTRRGREGGRTRWARPRERWIVAQSNRVSWQVVENGTSNVVHPNYVQYDSRFSSAC